jgi:hypothetical protein
MCKVSQWAGLGYTLGVSGSLSKVRVGGADITGSLAFVSAPDGSVGIQRSVSVTLSIGWSVSPYSGGLLIGSSTFTSLSGYSSYSTVPFSAAVGAGYGVGYSYSSNSSGITSAATFGYGVGAIAGAKGVSLSNNVQPFCTQ